MNDEEKNEGEAVAGLPLTVHIREQPTSSPTYNTSNSFFDDDDDLTDEEREYFERMAIRHYIHCIEYIALYDFVHGITKETPNA